MCGKNPSHILTYTGIVSGNLNGVILLLLLGIILLLLLYVHVGKKDTTAFSIREWESYTPNGRYKKGAWNPPPLIYPGLEKVKIKKCWDCKCGTFAASPWPQPPLHTLQGPSPAEGTHLGMALAVQPASHIQATLMLVLNLKLKSERHWKLLLQLFRQKQKLNSPMNISATRCVWFRAKKSSINISKNAKTNNIYIYWGDWTWCMKARALSYSLCEEQVLVTIPCVSALCTSAAAALRGPPCACLHSSWCFPFTHLMGLGSAMIIVPESWTPYVILFSIISCQS